MCVVAQPVIELWKLAIFVFLWWCEMWSELCEWVSECMDSGGGSQSVAWSSLALTTMTWFFQSIVACILSLVFCVLFHEWVKKNIFMPRNVEKLLSIKCTFHSNQLTQHLRSLWTSQLVLLLALAVQRNREPCAFRSWPVLHQSSHCIFLPVNSISSSLQHKPANLHKTKTFQKYPLQNVGCIWVLSKFHCLWPNKSKQFYLPPTS